jgi:hypothetical protein
VLAWAQHACVCGGTCVHMRVCHTSCYGKVSGPVLCIWFWCVHICTFVPAMCLNARVCGARVLTPESGPRTDMPLEPGG